MSVNLSMLSSTPTVTDTSGANTNTTVTNPNATLGKNDFLQLLVAELKNQDPMQQTDTNQYIAEMAQFSSLEQMQNVDTDVQQLNQTMQSVLLAGQIGQASSLIGTQVTGTDPNSGQSVTGTVTGVSINGQQVTLEPIGLPIENITSVTKGA